MNGKQIQNPVTDWPDCMAAAIRCNATKAMIEDKSDSCAVHTLTTQTLEEASTAKLAELNAAFAIVSENAGVMSSAGFEIDANDVANRIVSAETTVEETVRFGDRNNRFHDVTIVGLETILPDRIAHTRKLKAGKWALRECIREAQTPGELDAIDIVFPEKDVMSA